MSLFQHRQPHPLLEDASFRARLDGEINRLLLVQAHTSSLTGLAGVLAFAVIILPHHLSERFILWTTVMTALYLLRFFWLSRRISANPASSVGGMTRCWVYVFITLMGLGWGGAAWTFLWPREVVTQLPFLMILLGVLTLTPPILSAKPLAGYLFVVPLTTGLVLRLKTESPDAFVPATTVAILLAVFAMAVTHRHAHVSRKGMIQTIERDALLEKIEEARRRAEENAKAKSNFLATMSHEIRTPVNGLMGMLEILKDTDLTSTQANYLGTASRSAESLLQLLNDILDYSKLEVGRLELDKIPFDWVAMVGEIAMMNRVLATDREIAFHLEIPPECTSIVVGDPVRLRQILNNLLSNALKFTPEGSIWLKVNVDGEDASTVRLSFVVKDTGIGIAPDVQKKLFQKYQQASAATGARYGGSGLGLAISLQLAQLMGGTIRLESTPGMGSEFVLSVPFPKATPETLRTVSGDAAAVPRRYRVRVLVVEDDPVSQRVTVLMLKSFGITPTVVNGGGAALARAREEKFDLIFMDNHLPDMEGFDAAGEILEKSDPSSRPMIVAITGADTPEDRQRARQCGISEYLVKPVRKRDVRVCLDKWSVRRSRLANASKEAVRPAPEEKPEPKAVKKPRKVAEKPESAKPAPEPEVTPETPAPSLPEPPAPAKAPRKRARKAVTKVEAAEAPLPEEVPAEPLADAAAEPPPANPEPAQEPAPVPEAEEAEKTPESVAPVEPAPAPREESLPEPPPQAPEPPPAEPAVAAPAPQPAVPEAVPAPTLPQEEKNPAVAEPAPAPAAENPLPASQSAPETPAPEVTAQVTEPLPAAEPPALTRPEVPAQEPAPVAEAAPALETAPAPEPAKPSAPHLVFRAGGAKHSGYKSRRK
jgi:signal transduction histidine kinase/CheY-like chemotaxis protein